MPLKSVTYAMVIFWFAHQHFELSKLQMSYFDVTYVVLLLVQELFLQNELKYLLTNKYTCINFLTRNLKKIQVIILQSYCQVPTLCKSNYFSFVTSRQAQGSKKKPCLCQSWVHALYFYLFYELYYNPFTLFTPWSW